MKENLLIIKKVNQDTLIATTDGTNNEIELPKSSSGVPDVGDTVSLTNHFGYDIPHTIGLESDNPRFINFTYHEKENTNNTKKSNNKSDTTDTAKKVKPQSGYAFADVPPGTKKIESSNGSSMFAGDSLSGIAMSTSNKFLLRDDNSAEFITPYYTAILGRTVYVSSYKPNFAIEIDIEPLDDPKEPTLKQFLESISYLIKYECHTYKEAFDITFENATGYEANMTHLFGLHIADTISKAKWSRIKITGEVGFIINTYFNGELTDLSEIGFFISDILDDIDDCCYMEAYLIEEDKDNSVSYFNVKEAPDCLDISDVIDKINVKTEQNDLIVASMHIKTKKGHSISYAINHTVYAHKMANVAEQCYTHTIMHKSVQQTLHKKHDLEIIENLTVAGAGKSLCDEEIKYNSETMKQETIINFANDVKIHPQAQASLFALEDIKIMTPKTVTIIGQGKGLYIDDTGVSTISKQNYTDD